MATPEDQTRDDAAAGPPEQAQAPRERHKGPGQRLTFRTPNGELKAIMHRASGSKHGSSGSAAPGGALGVPEMGLTPG